ncbi:hypothetical protein BDV97DRAFT_355408 [Delphinella strobiligena]|nr:hypothetical protein BDV97DRAFT_355408 [Delphinella strobiligena]
MTGRDPPSLSETESVRSHIPAMVIEPSNKETLTNHDCTNPANPTNFEPNSQAHSKLIMLPWHITVQYRICSRHVQDLPRYQSRCECDGPDLTASLRLCKKVDEVAIPKLLTDWSSTLESHFLSNSGIGTGKAILISGQDFHSTQVNGLCIEEE